MDSGEYENYAKKSLLDKDGEVNIEAVKIAKDLSTEIPTYYWWWHDFDDGDFTECPNCNGALDQDKKHGVGKCEKCCIVA